MTATRRIRGTTCPLHSTARATHTHNTQHSTHKKSRDAAHAPTPRHAPPPQSRNTGNGKTPPRKKARPHVPTPRRRPAGAGTQGQQKVEKKGYKIVKRRPLSGPRLCRQRPSGRQSVSAAALQLATLQATDTATTNIPRFSPPLPPRSRASRTHLPRDTPSARHLARVTPLRRRGRRVHQRKPRRLVDPPARRR